jgi:hypothetical protein
MPRRSQGVPANEESLQRSKTFPTSKTAEARPPKSSGLSDAQKIKGMDEWKQKLATAFNEISERKLDRTRGYGHLSRENGRFGSHPSHDGFDDESKP